MDAIYVLTDEDLVFLRRRINQEGAYEVKFAIDGGVKVKVNGGTWSPPLGSRIALCARCGALATHQVHHLSYGRYDRPVTYCDEHAEPFRTSVTHAVEML